MNCVICNKNLYSEKLGSNVSAIVVEVKTNKQNHEIHICAQCCIESADRVAPCIETNKE